LDEAEREIRESLAILRGRREAPILVASLDVLGEILADSGKPNEAERAYRESLALSRKFNVPRDWAYTSSRLAGVLQTEGNLQEAGQLYLETGRFWGELAKQGDGEAKHELRIVFSSLMNLAGQFKVRGEQNKAQDLEKEMSNLSPILEASLREVISRKEELLSKHDRAIDEALAQLSVVLEQKGKVHEAEVIRREELEVEKELSGNEHTNVADSMIGLVRLLDEQGKYSEAETVCRQALAMRRRLEGNTNADVVNNLSWLAQALREQGKIAEAEANYRECYELGTNLFGPSDPRIEASLSWLGNCLLSQGKISDAKVVYCDAAELGNTSGQDHAAWLMATGPAEVRDGQRAIGFSEKAVAKTARTNAPYLNTLAAALAETGQFARAVAVQKEAMVALHGEDDRSEYQSALKLYESAVPYRDHATLAELANSLLQQAKFVEAEPVARECLALRERELPDGWRTFNARSMLGGALLGQKRFAEAEPLLVSGYEGMKQRHASLPPGSTRPREALQRLVELYEKTDRPERAAECKQERAELDKPPK
jgi:tetratricopeptide (TPR) repeat protein